MFIIARTVQRSRQHFGGVHSVSSILFYEHCLAFLNGYFKYCCCAFADKERVLLFLYVCFFYSLSAKYWYKCCTYARMLSCFAMFK